jgi:hypothetical protein
MSGPVPSPSMKDDRAIGNGEDAVRAETDLLSAGGRGRVPGLVMVAPVWDSAAGRRIAARLPVSRRLSEARRATLHVLDRDRAGQTVSQARQAARGVAMGSGSSSRAVAISVARIMRGRDARHSANTPL